MKGLFSRRQSSSSGAFYFTYPLPYPDPGFGPSRSRGGGAAQSGFRPLSRSRAPCCVGLHGMVIVRSSLRPLAEPRGGTALPTPRSLPNPSVRLGKLPRTFPESDAPPSPDDLPEGPSAIGCTSRPITTSSCAYDLSTRPRRRVLPPLFSL